MPYATFARQSGGGALPERSRERVLNWYVEGFPDAATAPASLIPCPGLTPFVSGLGGPVRAMLKHAGDLYAAANGRLWQITKAGVATDLGHIGDSPFTTLATNGQQVAAAVDWRYWVWDGSALTSPSPGILGRVGSVTAVSGFMVLSEEGGQKFQLSSIYDATTLDALDFASAEVRSDPLIAVAADHNDVWMLGEDTLESWYLSGDADFAMARYAGGTFNQGLLWRNAHTVADNTLWFVGADRVVYRASPGASPQRASTSRVEDILGGLGKGADVRMFSFDHAGHKFITIRLPDRPALTYDAASGVWTERNTGVDDGPWVGACALKAFGEQLVGGSDGCIHRLGGLTDGGRTIMREAISMPLDAGGAWFTLASVDLKFGQGRTDLETRPVCMVSLSRDGVTWDHERQVPLGMIGEYGWKSELHGLGRMDGAVTMRLRITDPVDAPLVGVAYEAKR